MKLQTSRWFLACCLLFGSGSLMASGCGEEPREQLPAPPAVDALTAAQQTLEPGAETTVTLSVQGAEGESLPEGMRVEWAVDGEGWSISGGDEQGSATATLSAPSSYRASGTVRVTLTDDHGQSVTETAAVSTIGNVSPAITAIEATPNPVGPGGTVALSAAAEDPHGDDLSYSWSAPEGWTLKAESGKAVELTAPDEQGARGRVELTVSDGHGGRAHGSVAVDTSRNAPPVIASVTADPPQLAPGATTTLRVSANDPDGDALDEPARFSWSVPSEWSLSGEGSEVSVTAPDSYGATARIGVTVNDGNEGEATGEIVVTTRENQGPTITSLSADPPTVERGGTIDLTVEASDPNGDMLAYGWTVADQSWALSDNGKTAQLTAPDTAGVRTTVTVELADAEGKKASATLVVSTRPNNAPSLDSITANPTTVAPGNTTKLQAAARDADGDDLTYKWTIPAGWKATGNGSGPQITLKAPDSYGQTDVVDLVVSDDSGGTVQGSVVVTTRDNRAPVLGSLVASPTVLQPGATSTVTVAATDPDGDSLTYKWTPPQGWTAKGTGASIKLTAPNKHGVTGTLAVQIDDGHGGTTRGIVALQVLDEPRNPPTIDSLVANPSTLQPKQKTTVTAKASDPNGDALSYKWTLPRGWSGSSTSNSITVTAPDKYAEKVAIKLEVSDGTFAPTASVAVETVANKPPAITSLTADPNPASAGQTVTATVKASDPLGDKLSYTWSRTNSDWSLSGNGATATLTAPNKQGSKTTLKVVVDDGHGLTAKKTVQLSTISCAGGKGDCDGNPDNGCEVDLNSDKNNCGSCGNVCAGRKVCVQGRCRDDGVFAFNEFRKAMDCADFRRFDSNYRRWCFELKGQYYCTGNTSGGNHTCQDTNRGVKFTFDWGRTWPMRFNNNRNSCLNYHPNYIQNFAKAIGYANVSVLRRKSGNSCTRTWLDSNGNYRTTSGNSSQRQIYEVEFYN